MILIRNKHLRINVIKTNIYTFSKLSKTAKGGLICFTCAMLSLSPEFSNHFFHIRKQGYFKWLLMKLIYNRINGKWRIWDGQFLYNTLETLLIVFYVILYILQIICTRRVIILNDKIFQFRIPFTPGNSEVSWNLPYFSHINHLVV